MSGEDFLGAAAQQGRGVGRTAAGLSKTLSGFSCISSLNAWQFSMPLFEKKYSAIVLASMSAPVTFSSQRRVRMSSQ